ncbi:MAG: alpha-L-fucosidase [Sedimentisphaerales bacterium]|nr:alpha-L-fucosidase [Sedimentisphaerales bacterium]
MRFRTNVTAPPNVTVLVILFLIIASTNCMGKEAKTPPANKAMTSANPVSQSDQIAEAQAKRQERLKWFHEAKYGLFINWGLYSIPAGEWKGKPIPWIGEWIMYSAKIPVKEYEQLAGQFNPVKFNADEWAQLAKDSGMKYLVFDCKHHDGFALYHSKVSKYNVYDATPWHRDPMKELSEACKKRGIRLCFYYSQATDWHEPNGAGNDWDFLPNEQKDFDQYLRDKSLPQVEELLRNYGPIGLIWFDVPRLMNAERCKQFTDLVRSIQPKVLVNSRLGSGSDYDYLSMGDNYISNTIRDEAWETAATINDTWGYKKDDHNWKSPADITFKLVDIVSKGGNYLLNVGPTAEGVIPEPSQVILRRVGKWLSVNGEAIYGAGTTPFGDELGHPIPGKKDNRGRQIYNVMKDWRCTTQPGKLYLHLFTWPKEKFEIDGFKQQVVRAYWLADPDRKSVTFTQVGEKLTISLPEQAPDELDSVLCLEIK